MMQIPLPHASQFLSRILNESSGPLKAERLPSLCSEIEHQQQDHWERRQDQARWMRCDSNRHGIQLALLQLGQGSARA